MKIVVLLKKTPDTETKIAISSDGTSIDHSATKYITNPYDLHAIEEALKIKQSVGDAEIVLASFTDPSTKELMIKGLGMGADRGLIINNEGLENLDSLGVAKVLAAALKEESADLVLCGRHAIDDDNMHVGIMTAALLDMPHVNVASKVEVDGSALKIERLVEAGQVEVFEGSLPALIGVDKAINTPRYAALPGIMKAKRKPFDIKTVSDFGLSVDELNTSTKVKAVKYEYPAEKPSGKIFKGEDVGSMVEKVVNLLKDEAKVL